VEIYRDSKAGKLMIKNSLIRIPGVKNGLLFEACKFSRNKIFPANFASMYFRWMEE
jgi:hypothetical protein